MKKIERVEKPLPARDRGTPIMIWINDPILINAIETIGNGKRSPGIKQIFATFRDEILDSAKKIKKQAS